MQQKWLQLWLMCCLTFTSFNACLTRSRLKVAEAENKDLRAKITRLEATVRPIELGE